jgi:hypothetical protein
VHARVGAAWWEAGQGHGVSLTGAALSWEGLSSVAFTWKLSEWQSQMSWILRAQAFRSFIKNKRSCCYAWRMLG